MKYLCEYLIEFVGAKPAVILIVGVIFPLYVKRLFQPVVGKEGLWLMWVYEPGE